MTVKELLNAFHDALDNGLDSLCEVQVFDANAGEYCAVSGFLYGGGDCFVDLQTDADEGPEDGNKETHDELR